jgi:hypothetical protein
VIWQAATEITQDGFAEFELPPCQGQIDAGVSKVGIQPEAGVMEMPLSEIKRLAEFVRSWRPNERGLLFATKNGTPWNADLLLKRKFKPLLKQLAISIPRGTGFHALRHANATMMGRLGTPLKLRQARLGHEDGSPITQSIYSHVVTEDAKRVASQLGDEVWGKVSATVN